MMDNFILEKIYLFDAFDNKKTNEPVTKRMKWLKNFTQPA